MLLGKHKFYNRSKKNHKENLYKLSFILQWYLNPYLYLGYLQALSSSQ